MATKINPARILSQLKNIKYAVELLEREVLDGREPAGSRPREEPKEAEMRAVADWFDLWCSTNNKVAGTNRALLWESFDRWRVDEGGIRYVNRPCFFLALERMGFDRTKYCGVNCFRGVCLLKEPRQI